VRRLTILLLAVATAASLAACGNQRQHPPGTPRAADPIGPLTAALPRYGVTFRHPANWPLGRLRPPLLAAFNSGQATVVLWRYAREEQLPRNDGELLRARSARVAAARARDRTLRVLSARSLRVSGVPAVQILADERILRARRRVRSTHVYGYGAELVVDAYAPLGDFARVDRRVFGPMLRSLRVQRPLPPRRS
jgi:hypothetical protein